jgi:hypothetical protein
MQTALPLFVLPSHERHWNTKPFGLHRTPPEQRTEVRNWQFQHLRGALRWFYSSNSFTAVCGFWLCQRSLSKPSYSMPILSNYSHSSPSNRYIIRPSYSWSSCLAMVYHVILCSRVFFEPVIATDLVKAFFVLISVEVHRLSMDLILLQQNSINTFMP